MHATVWMPIAGDGAIEEGVVLPIEGFHFPQAGDESSALQTFRAHCEQEYCTVFASIHTAVKNTSGQQVIRHHIFVRLWVL
jgi:hypothetical protein